MGCYISNLLEIMIFVAGPIQKHNFYIRITHGGD